MKNISPAKKGETTKTIIMFIIFFLISEFIIVRPLRNKMESKQREAKEIEQMELEEQKNNVDNGIAGENIIIENEYLKLNINTKGLRLNDVVLKKYKNNVNFDEKVKILNNNYYVDINWLSFTNGLKLPDNNSLWTVKTNNNNTIFSYDNEEGVIFRVILSLDDKYMLNINQVVENNKYNRLYVKPFWQIIQKQNKDNADLTAFAGGIGVFNEKLEEIKLKKLKNKNIEFEKFNWAGLTSKYWLASFINNEKSNGTVNYLQKGNVVKVQYTTKNNVIVLKDSFVGTKNKIFIGAKDLDILKEYRDKENVKLFDRSVDFGLFYFLAKPLNSVLDFFNDIVHNFGVAIILLTIIIKMILYPSVKKSFISMAKMKKAQPEMKRIQEKYKNDKLAMQQELLKLYKKYELNPMSSITPLFIQIPVFFSLYKVISVNLNMRHAPFFAYIKDLSGADPTSIFNLFGLLPFDVPFKVGLLPCIMALSMYIQQKITDKMQGGSENINEDMKAANGMLKYLPLLFLFMFSGFPAGLLLYWIFNNIITILQQMYITNKYMKK
ncbi:MAG: membrane protein insertase YidC [Rickettsiales bacterium]|nr:membrane protein insertase YidC [Rickettsiales bacterium]